MRLISSFAYPCMCLRWLSYPTALIFYIDYSKKHTNTSESLQILDDIFPQIGSAGRYDCTDITQRGFPVSLDG
jgi:hypothetical protein